MKKSVLITLTVVFMASGMVVFSQNQSRENELKNEIRVLKSEDRSIFGTSLKAKKKELRQLEAKDVDYFTKQQFAEDFGDVANVNWKRFNYYDEADFMNNGVETKAFYDNQPELIGTIVNKTFTELPVRAQKEINKKYGDYQKGTVILFDDNEYNDMDVLLYNEPFTGPDTYFIELAKNGKNVIVGLSELGEIEFHKELK